MNSERGRPSSRSAPAKPMLVQQPEREHQPDAPRLQLGRDEVLHGDVHNRQGDQRFDGGGSERHHAVQPQAERNRVRYGERGYLPEDRPETTVEQKNPEHEQDVIEPVRHDVREAQRKIGGRDPAARWRHVGRRARTAGCSGRSRARRSLRARRQPCARSARTDAEVRSYRQTNVRACTGDRPDRRTVATGRRQRVCGLLTAAVLEVLKGRRDVASVKRNPHVPDELRSQRLDALRVLMWVQRSRPRASGGCLQPPEERCRIGRHDDHGTSPPGPSVAATLVVPIS